MGRYLMTHSLLASWLYTMKENPYEDMTTERDPMGEFMQTLRREPTPTTEAMQNGIKFRGHGDGHHQRPRRSQRSVVCRRRKGRPALRRWRPPVQSQEDCGGRRYEPSSVWPSGLLKAGEIIDIKFTKSYDTGKFFPAHSTTTSS